MTSPSDPFRFDDRTGHYGSSQADLAPVSPLAATPRDGDDARPLDPMGAAPTEGQIDDEGPTPRSTDRTETRADTRSDTQISTQAQSGTASAQSGSGAASQTEAVTGPRESPVRDEAPPTQTVLLRMQTDMRIEAEVRADAPAAPVMSSGTPVSLLPKADPGAAGAAGDFADMAARMDQMMVEMTARMEALSSRLGADDEDDDTSADRLVDAQDRLDDLFGSLGDRLGGGAAPDTADEPALFEAARDHFDDLSGGLRSRDGAEAGSSSDSFSAAVARLDDLKVDLDRDDRTDPDAAALPPVEASLLARLFDGDAAPDEPSPVEARMAELLDEMEAPTFTPPVPDLYPGRWDDLPDFG